METDIETIYVIDDKPRVSEALPSSLRAGSKNARLFTSGVHFLSINRDNTAARLILDRQMPEPNGADAQRFVSTTIRIVFVSGPGDSNSAVKPMKGGVSDFPTKPVDEALLLTAVERALDPGRNSVCRPAKRR